MSEFTLPDNPKTLMRSIIQRIATGPELSKDISFEEARAGMKIVLDREANDVQSALFLIGLRVKRETDDEFKGVLQATLDETTSVTAPVDEVLALADPYDGYNRTIPSSPFLPAVLAALGIPVVSEGVETCSPKFGVTHRQVLRAAGIRVDWPIEEAANQLAKPEIGWVYVDQEQFCPKLNSLIDLRTQMVKRPVITTTEVSTGPIRGRLKTHLLTGFVHKPYPRVYAFLARYAGFDSILLVRGVEGGITPSLRQKGRVVYFHEGGAEQDYEMEPAELGIEQEQRSLGLPENLPVNQKRRDGIGMEVDSRAVAGLAAEKGIAALKGEHGIIRDGLIYTGALTIKHMGKAESLAVAADQVRKAIDSGRALAHLEAAVA